MTRNRIGDEKQILSEFLDQQLDVLLWKLEGLTDDQLRQPGTPSSGANASTTPLASCRPKASRTRGFSRDAATPDHCRPIVRPPGYGGVMTVSMRVSFHGRRPQAASFPSKMGFHIPCRPMNT